MVRGIKPCPGYWCKSIEMAVSIAKQMGSSLPPGILTENDIAQRLNPWRSVSDILCCLSPLISGK
jgi:hypothetical protein